MADKKSKIRYDDFIGNVQPDPAKPESTIMLSGFVGRGPEGHARIYPDPTLGTWYDVPEDAVVYSTPIADSKLGGSYVWVRASAQIKPGSAAAGAATGLEAAAAQPPAAIAPQPTPATHCFICPPHVTPATVCTQHGPCLPPPTPGCTPQAHCPPTPTPATQCPFCLGTVVDTGTVVGTATAVPTVCFCSPICQPTPACPPTPMTQCFICTYPAACTVGQTGPGHDCATAPQLRPNAAGVPAGMGTGVFNPMLAAGAAPAMAGAAPQAAAAGMHPTPATHCFVCDPPMAAPQAIQPTPTAQTHCFICPPLTQQINCRTQPVVCDIQPTPTPQTHCFICPPHTQNCTPATICTHAVHCDTMQTPTPATRCFICPPLQTQQVWCPTQPVVCNFQHTQPVVCGIVPPTVGCQQGGAQPRPEAAMAAAGLPNTLTANAACTAPPMCPQTLVCPTPAGVCPTAITGCWLIPSAVCGQAPQAAVAAPMAMAQAVQPTPTVQTHCFICPPLTQAVLCRTRPVVCDTMQPPTPATHCFICPPQHTVAPTLCTVPPTLHCTLLCQADPRAAAAAPQAAHAAAGGALQNTQILCTQGIATFCGCTPGIDCMGPAPQPGPTNFLCTQGLATFCGCTPGIDCMRPAAKAAPQAVGINPTPATHCFVCDPLKAAVQPTPTVQTHCFICPPHTQAIHCPSHPVVCDTMQMPTPATRCFICPPPQQTAPNATCTPLTVPVWVCGQPTLLCQQAGGQQRLAAAAAAGPATVTQDVLCGGPSLMICPTTPEALCAPAPAPQAAAVGIQPTPFCTIPPNCPAQTELVACPTQMGACTLPVQCYQNTWFACQQGGAQQQPAAGGAAWTMLATRCICDPQAPQAGVAGMQPTPFCTIPPNCPAQTELVACPTQMGACTLPVQCYQNTWYACQQGGAQQPAAAAVGGPAQTAATLCTAPQACFPTMVMCPTNIGVCPTVMTGCFTAPSGLCAAAPAQNGVFTPFGR